MNKMISMKSHEKIMKEYESWLKTPFLLETGITTSNVFVVVNSPRLNFYGNDFGWGKPIAIRNGIGLDCNIGKVTVIGGAEEGSIDVEVCLPYDILEAMGNDHLLMDAISA